MGLTCFRSDPGDEGNTKLTLRSIGLERLPPAKWIVVSWLKAGLGNKKPWQKF